MRSVIYTGALNWQDAIRDNITIIVSYTKSRRIMNQIYSALINKGL